MSTTLISIIGARPQFVKAAIVSKALAALPGINHEIIHTGQHFDRNMSDVFFEELGIPEPTLHLDVRSPHHGEMTGRMLTLIEQRLLADRPHAVILYGDTNSTLAGALAASKLHVPIAHVEAGLRAFNRIPEEINRVLTDHVSDLLFSVTDQSTANLAREGISGPHVHQVGDVMHDCALQSAGIARRRSDALTRFGLEPGRYALATAHRANNTDDPVRLASLISALERVAAHLPVLLPLHPRTRARLQAANITVASPNLKLVDPVSYIDMVRLELDAAVIVTDSGGVQREAFFHRRPCVTVRDETEWTELVTLGWNVLAPLDDPRQLAELILGRVGVHGQDAAPYGHGDTGERIARVLADVQNMSFVR